MARLAPLVRISSALISVGYSHGTPSTPIPKEAKKRKKLLCISNDAPKQTVGQKTYKNTATDPVT